MKSQLAVNIALTVAELMRVTVNPVELRAQVRTVGEAEDENLKGVVKQVIEVGKLLNLTFLENRLSARDCLWQLEAGLLPLLVFIETEQGVQPLVLTHFQRGAVRGRLMHDDTYTELRLSFDELMRRMVNPDAATDAAQPSVFVLSPMVIQPVVGRGEENETLSPLKRLWRLLAADRREIGFIYIYATFVGLLSLTMPLGVQAIIGLISGGLLLEPVIVLIGLVIFATLLSGGLQVMQVRMVEVLQQRIFAKAAFEFAFRTPLVKMEAISRQYAPELMNRFFDIITIQKGYTKLLTDVLTALLQIFFGLLVLAFYHPFFIFFSLVLLAVMIVMFRLTGPRGLRTSLEESKYKYKVVHWLEEVARTLSTFKLAGYTNLPLEKMDHHVSYYLEKRQAHFRVLVTQYVSIVLFKVLITGSTLILGCVLVIERQITLGQFVATEIIIITIMQALEKIIVSLENIYDVLTALDKVGQVTDLPLDKTGGVNITDSLPKTDHRGFDIKIRGLKYRYPGETEYTLRGLDLDIRAGERIGVTGADGAGKTTFLNVVTGLYESYEGLVAYNGFSLRDLNITSLRDEVGDNLSASDIFEGTIEENIAVGKPDITIADVLDALERVGLADYVHQLPKGVYTLLVSGGKTLPSTVAKRIILARSIAERPRLLVFDDFFINTPATFNENIVERILCDDMPWTVLTISQSPRILQRCHRVLVMEDGLIAKIIPGAELMRDPAFRHLMPDA